MLEEDQVQLTLLRTLQGLTPVLWPYTSLKGSRQAGDPA